MPALRLLVADDHEIVRKGLCDILGKQPGWAIIAQARDGREAVSMARELKPDVAVLDISMPGLNGLEAARQISKCVPETKVLVLTMHESEVLIAEALETGVRGFLIKTDAATDLVDAVSAVSRNETFFRSEVAGTIPPRYRLTGRQREILQLLAEGKTSKEVSTVLDISVKTVDVHRANMMRGLGYHCIADLVRYAIRNFIIDP